MDGEWPAWATQPVEIVDPDPDWPAEAAKLIDDLERRLASWRDGAIEHVGSTAVAGLPAKPVIDLLAPVSDLDGVAGAHRMLADGGWQLVPPELDQRPWRRLYVLPDGERRRAHLHLVARSHPKWQETLAFRDTLRRQPGLAADYASVKRAAARDHHDDREAYTAAKSSFIAEVVAARSDPSADH